MKLWEKVWLMTGRCERWTGIAHIKLVTHFNKSNSRDRILTEKLTGSQLVKKCSWILWNQQVHHRIHKRLPPVSNPGLLWPFRNMDTFLWRGVVSMENHPLSVFRDFLFTIFAAALLLWRQFLHPQPEDRLCRGDGNPIIMALSVIGMWMLKVVPADQNAARIYTRHHAFCRGRATQKGAVFRLSGCLIDAPWFRVMVRWA